MIDEARTHYYSHLYKIHEIEYLNYLDHVKKGYITLRHHPEDDNIIVLNYTEQAANERLWNTYTMSARGLILDIRDLKSEGYAYILAKGFDKFFNYGEYPKYEKDIDWNEVEGIYEKMDGSLGITYHINGEIRVATRGSFTSKQAIKATEMYQKNVMSKLINYPLFTMLFEIIYPENRIVVDYKGEEELVLLDVRSIDKNKNDESIHYLKDNISMISGLTLPKEYNYSLEEMLEKKEELDYNTEGWIVKFNNGKRLKIKTDDYVKVHRILYGMSTKELVKTWANDDLDKVKIILPEELLQNLENFVNILENKHKKIMSSLYNLLSIAKEEANNCGGSRKDFALYVEENIIKNYRRFMYIGFDKGYIDDKLVKDYIYRNYINLLGGNEWLN